MAQHPWRRRQSSTWRIKVQDLVDAEYEPESSSYRLGLLEIESALETLQPPEADVPEPNPKPKAKPKAKKPHPMEQIPSKVDVFIPAIVPRVIVNAAAQAAEQRLSRWASNEESARVFYEELERLWPF